MGYVVTKYDEFTSSENVNKAILGLSIIRMFLYTLFFIFNFNQTFKEYKIGMAKSKKFYLKNARIFSFTSITLFSFMRIAMIGVFLYDKSIYNGSIWAALSIWGTLIQYLLWVSIAGYWMSLLYTFFISKDIVAKNTNAAWTTTYIITLVLIIWTILQTIFNFYFVDLMNLIYGPIQVVIICGIGGFYVINGYILVRGMKSHEMNGSKIEKLKETYKRIIRLSILLLLFVVLALLLYLIQYQILKLEDYDKENYIFYMIVCCLEFSQLFIIMYSLGGDSFKCYFIFSFKPIENANTSFKNYSTTISTSSTSSSTRNEIELKIND
ncbi:hypothetical protein RB653_000590 [Dictyostelium firmibasis]|uniref:THH1/TOM1/TOM3 domain-containing protein n=1 Tax=Dictyostelium firmibasis TaxID=79012 RepID=A0AAN7U329_9MYCE